MSITLLIFLAGIIVLLISTRIFVDAATKISFYLRISPLIIGATVVALGTSLPELTVSIFAILRGDPGLAAGNIIGSNIANILLVFPIGILFGGIRIGTTKTQRNGIMLLAATVIFFVFFKYFASPIAGVILIGLAVMFTIKEYQWGIFGRLHEDLARFDFLKKKKFKIKTFIFLPLSVIGVIIGGFLTVSSVETIALETGFSTTILGFTLTSIATSLPEIFTTVISEKKGEDKMVVGNLIGSNVYNLMLIGGVILLFASAEKISLFEWFSFIISAFILYFLIFFYKGRSIRKLAGIILLLLFTIYLSLIHII